MLNLEDYPGVHPHTPLSEPVTDLGEGVGGGGGRARRNKPSARISKHIGW